MNLLSKEDDVMAFTRIFGFHNDNVCHFTGMRRDVNVLIFLDVRKALEGM